MITGIEVNGFKTLEDFNLDIQPGLNILVGPNGSGKSNIIQFFEFLANITEGQIGRAVSKSGGLSSVFQKSNHDQFAEKIDCKIKGTIEVPVNQELDYEYNFTVSRSEKRDYVYFSHQRLKLFKKSLMEPHEKEKAALSLSTLDIEYKLDGQSTIFVVHSLDDCVLMDSMYLGDNTKVSIEMIKKEVMNKKPVDYSLIHTLLSFDYCFYLVSFDFRESKTFIIEPNRVRELEDSTNPPGINKDGSGLSATLYALAKHPDTAIDDYHTRSDSVKEVSEVYNRISLQRIIELLMAANSTIQDLMVNIEPYDNKIRVTLHLKSGDSEVDLPLSAMSDGTIKWLTLITIILTSKSLFSIEEPENYLHPWMQAEILRIIRNNIESKTRQAAVLITTHSETLINYARPEDLVLVSLKDGKTTTRRLSDRQEKSVNNEISLTGHGLGHFYFSGVLSDE